MIEDIGLWAPLAGAIGLVCALIMYLTVTKQSPGTDKMKAIGEEIHLGAMTFLKAEYTKLSVFVLVVAGILFFVFNNQETPLGWQTAVSFVTGAICSALAGFIGMKAATKGNVRTAAAAKDKGSGGALLVAFNSGAVMGLAVASLGLVGLGLIYWAFGENLETVSVVSGFSMGASSIALF
ncbi:MAG: sodium-translocating pyrophosphatase, partial [Bdellovibrio sp.]